MSNVVGNTNLAEIDTRVDTGELTSAASLDPAAGGVYLTKPIWALPDIVQNMNRTGYDWYHDNYGELSDGVLNYGFWLNYEELANSYYVNATGTIAFDEAYYQDAFSPFNAGQMGLARQAIGLWDDLISISFRETKSGNADITYGNTDTGGAQAYAYLPFGSGDDAFYSDNYDFDEAGRLGGDVWIDGFVSSNFAPLTASYYAQTTMIHETGHALGLSHPGNYNAIGPDGTVLDPTYANQAEYAQDSLQYSIMSYFDGYETGAQFIDFSLLNFAYPSTPMVHDIATIQSIYGADMTTRSGDTVYGFNSTADRSVYDFTVNTRPIVTIWDGGGKDTIDFSGWNTPSTIDLNAGAFSSGGGIEEFLSLDQINANRAALGFAPRTQAAVDFYESIKSTYDITSPLYHDNIAIAYGVTIENAVGGGGNDVIIGNDAANVLTGNGGADLFEFLTATRHSGADRIKDFSKHDVIGTDKAIFDGDGDGIITYTTSKGVMIDKADGDTVKLDGLNGSKGLRYLGSDGSLFYYGNAAVRPVAAQGEKVFESKLGNEVLKGSSSTSIKDIFFFDTANAAPSTGRDTVTFTGKDLIVTTTALNDNNKDGIITIGNDHLLMLSGKGGEIAFTGSTNRLEFDGVVHNGDVDYFVYSTVGSSVGVADLHV